MQNKSSIVVTVWLIACHPEDPEHYFLAIGEEGPVSSFLYDVGKKWRQFWVRGLNDVMIELVGECTESELTQLKDDIEAFFDLHGLHFDANHWDIRECDHLSSTRAERVREMYGDIGESDLDDWS